MTDITPVALWKGFDPDAEELNPRRVRSFTRDGVVFEYAYFTGRTKDNLTTRVACLSARPDNIGKKKLPVVIVCDIARNIDEDTLSYWAKKGFAAFAVDYKGADFGKEGQKCGTEVFGRIDSYEEDGGSLSAGLSTIYPVGMEYCNLSVAEKDLKSVEYGADNTCWYEWTLNTRRAVSYALSFDFADGKRIGIYGSHLGNIIAMQTLAMDGRIAAGAELYGTLKEEHVSRLEGEEALERESGNLVDFLEKSDNEDVWYAAVSPQSYLNYVTKPFYTCIGTNSSSSAPDATMEMLFRMNNDNEGIAVFAPRLMDGAPSFYRDNLARWFKNIFEGKTVKNDAVTLSAVCEKGKIYVEAARYRNQGGGVANAEVYYSRSRRSVNSARNWVLAKKVEGEALRFNLEIFDADTPVRAFLNVTYKNGISMSFNMPEFVPSALGKVSLSPKTKIILRGGKRICAHEPHGASDSRLCGRAPRENRRGSIRNKGRLRLLYGDVCHFGRQNSAGRAKPAVHGYLQRNSSALEYIFALRLGGGESGGIREGGGACRRRAVAENFGERRRFQIAGNRQTVKERGQTLRNMLRGGKGVCSDKPPVYIKNE